jgi:hypothetical protein
MRGLKIRVRDPDSLGYIMKAFSTEPKLGNNRLGEKSKGHYTDMPRFVQKQDKPFGFFDIWFPELYRSLDNWGWLDSSGLRPRCPIYILSKGREKCITAQYLDKMGADYTIVVEPQEEEKYRFIWGDRVHAGDFDTSTGTSIPVRNYIHGLCGSDRYWLMDDNIEAFNVLTDNNKYEARTPVIFRATEDFCDRFDNIGMAGLNYNSFCKKTDAVPPYYTNTRVYSCSLMYRNLADVSVDGKLWRGKWNEDTDLSLRILKAGYCTLLMNSFLAGKVTTQRMSGGNTDYVYSDGDNREGFAQSLVDQHPDVARKSFKFGRWHHHVDYSGFKQELNYIGHEKVDYGLYLDENARLGTRSPSSQNSGIPVITEEHFSVDWEMDSNLFPLWKGLS